MAITIEQIHATADLLNQEGVKPTQMNVRERLGGGSFSTIAEGLKSWRVENETVAQLAQVVIPQDITDRTQTLIAQVWETAQSIANDRLVADREALAVKENILVAENDELQTVIKTLERENVDLSKQLEEVTADLAASNAKLQEFSGANAELVQRNGQLKLDLDKANERETALVNDLATAQQRYENLMQDLTKTAIENAKLQGQIETLGKFEQLSKEQASEINKLTADLATATANATNNADKITTLTADLTKATDTAQAHADEIKQLNKDLATTRATVTARDELVQSQADEIKSLLTTLQTNEPKGSKGKSKATATKQDTDNE